MIKKPNAKIDLNNTESAFEPKSDSALKKAAWLYTAMNSPTFVKVGSTLGLLALKMRLPVQWLIKQTIFEQFCGGTNLLNSQQTIDELAEFGVQSVLDYGAEGKDTEAAFNKTMREILEGIKFASRNSHVPFVVAKVTGLGRFDLLVKVQTGKGLSVSEQAEYDNVIKRLDAICFAAKDQNAGIFIDAEESWVQDTIDHLVNMMMARYNKEKATVYNTFQMYRHDRLAYLKTSFQMAQKEGYILGAKVVRGAYMDKERKRAEVKNYPSPIQPNKAATDADYDAAIAFCTENYERLASCTATHNAKSCELQVELIERLNLPKTHEHFLYSQLYGMSDNLTFNLQKSGYNTSKYIPYGPVKDVVPYLIRRAEENSSVTGDMGRELSFIKKEIKRRGL
jgi:proline dehydrogenase